MKKFLYLHNKNITVSLKSTPQDVATQIANAICINLLPNYDQVLESVMHVSAIFLANPDITLVDLLRRSKSKISSLGIDIVQQSFVSDNLSVTKGLVFNNITSYQDFIDKWFDASQCVTVDKNKVNFKIKFIDDMLHEVRQQMHSHHLNKNETWIMNNVLPIVEAYESELIVNLKTKLTDYINILRG